ncbi:accessory gene regulator B [Ruminiclostridium sufflavum DSM 19573]|uniref:Accessory gene regulator B n=1 Tax=Ruminiclostridium sufflavum DSM 19573 TaxID=1121337 RepID=A0A318XNL9_9FIRM|nr:accessory gene regulator B family protein [Ruminiclostridium sufflavum]PYG88511.1 accessory gene regulator B [Ruminiclostridium sufflavum DSM 19573]
MLKKITKKITAQIVASVPGTSKEKAEQINYGLYIAFSDGLKLIAVLLVALGLGQFKFVLVAVAVFAINKSYFGGVHAKTQLGCIITHFILMFGSVYLSDLINIRYLNIILFVISGILMGLYAPADLASRPIITEKRKKELRIKGSILLVMWFIITCIVPVNYSNIISIVTLISTINLTPVIYRITKNQKGGIC